MRLSLILLTLVALAADAPRKIVVLVYFPSDPLTKTSAETAIQKLRAKACGYEVIDIAIESSDGYLLKIKEALAGKKIPPTAPVFFHGHGMEDKDNDHVFIAKKPKLDLESRKLLPRQVVKSKDVMKAIRASLKLNPVWVSSCQSGHSCFKGDHCVGSSCLSKEDSYGEVTEQTLDEMVTLLCDEKKFKEAAGGDTGVIAPEKLNAHFCKVMGEKTIEESFTLCPPDRIEGIDPITQADFDKKVETAKRKYGAENVKTGKKDRLVVLTVTLKGTACYKKDDWKTQSPQVNNFRLYLPSYVPKPGELEGLVDAASKADTHAK